MQTLTCAWLTSRLPRHIPIVTDGARIGMIIIEERVLRYPASTSLALACAADALAMNATTKAIHDRFACARDRHLRAVDGGALVDEPTSPAVQRDALETLRTNPAARWEAREAVALLYGDYDLPGDIWTVHAFGVSPIAPRFCPVALI